MNAIYLIKFGEISLKKENRNFYEKKLKSNLRRNIEARNAQIKYTDGRFYVETPEENAPQIEKALSRTFGIVGFSRTRRVQKDIEIIKRTAKKVVETLQTENPALAGTTSFKIEARRTDKSFKLNSYEIACEIGDYLMDQFEGLSVDVHSPDIKIYVEIREEAFIYGNPSRGPGGLPVGTAGRGLLMLSGGIDSPVAGHMMAKRGLKLDCVYFHAYPYTSEDALNKVKELAKILSPYIGGTNFFVVPFTETQLRINERALPQEVTLLMRAGMVKIAEILAHRNRAACLVTGESLSQVASQTLESITFTGSAAQMPVFRPLMGLDKEEIIQRARAVGTFETSILPYDDCCTIFTAEHPLLKPGMERMWNSWNSLEIEQLLTQAADKTERHYVHPIFGYDTSQSSE
ncbi:MAG: tRNA 4-thiouridine(8) synthase ThiI [Spirochaetaceae bacterium]|nr:tRNA 4-thiouridine(8) synthase ThiI [Spirochaetaceae bacterium]MCF7948680.1 tRNA 4-thiouridine(8) synthase ThiI [Spirochaetia bacterium]MCF7951704.1 tRNA 4-thiouridine(8) synthase ThiI [Spirochaetaceae bacterium]